ncbi:DNA-3-methyladenine glycosylase [Candidatus Woesearchaeota archaeon]|nr:DNA-3-methyladenine glycosylase [Candidatus Woesearchaeota archaeon]
MVPNKSIEEYYIPQRSEALDRKFFARPAEEVAKELLGRVLVREREGKAQLYARLTEVAPWEDDRDMAKETLYAPGSLIVITRHAKKVLGVATLETGFPSCVTFISGDIYDKVGLRERVHGPGNLTKALEIGTDEKELDGVPIDFSPLWFGGEAVSQDMIKHRKPSKLPNGCKGYFYYK